MQRGRGCEFVRISETGYILKVSPPEFAEGGVGGAGVGVSVF